MLSGTIDSPLLKTLIDIMSMLTEIDMMFTKEGMIVRQLDSSKAMMLDILLPPSSFKEYNCDDTTIVSLGKEDITKVVKRSGKTDIIDFRIVDNQFELVIKGSPERRFKMNMLSSNKEPSKSPSLSHDASMEMSIDVFKTIIKDISTFSNRITISVDIDKNVSFYGTGDFAETSVSSFEEGIINKYNVISDSKSVYSVSYLSDFSKSMSGDYVTINLSTNKPLVLSFSPDSNARISIVIAPVVDGRGY